MSSEEESEKHECATEDELSQRQKKELKQLQGVITKLKHSAKHDKGKKKEHNDEVVRLQTEMAKKHEQELAELRLKLRDISIAEGKPLPCTEPSSGLPNSESDDAEDQKKAPKVTKAQKRRDKKEASARQRAEEIALAEEEAKNGERHKEEERFRQVLSDKRLRLHSIAADGDCLYNAVAHQLSLCGVMKRSSELRREAATAMRENRDDYLPFLTDQSGDVLSESEFEAYCDKLLNPSVWGGNPELMALSTRFKKPIEILQAGSASIVVGEQYLNKEKPLIITYHRHAFCLGEHYNSTVPVTDNSASQNNK